MKRTLVNLLLLVLVSAVMLGAFEGFLRAFYDPALTPEQMTTFDPVLGWRLVPGTYKVRRIETLVSHEIRVNTLGMRNPEITLTPAPGTKRVLLLGDSFTFGMLVPEQKLLATVAGDELRRGGGSFEVVNTGAQGYGTAQHLLYTRELQERGFRADLVVVLFFLNDLLDNLRMSYEDGTRQPLVPGFTLDASGRPVLTHAPERRFPKTGTVVPRSAGRSLYLATFLRGSGVSLLETHRGLLHLADRLGFRPLLPRMPAMISGWYDDAILAEGWPLTEALLRELRREAASRGAGFSVAVIPSPFQVYGSYEDLVRSTFPGEPAARAFLADPRKPQRLLRGFCEREGIPCLDLEGAFREARDGPSLYSPKDHHFSARGHEVAGRALAPFCRTVLEARTAPAE